MTIKVCIYLHREGFSLAFGALPKFMLDGYLSKVNHFSAQFQGSAFRVQLVIKVSLVFF
jgi:hypothetical protein